MLYIEDQRLVIETIAPGFITSDGTRLSPGHLAALAVAVGATLAGKRVDKVRLVFVAMHEAERMLPMISHFGFECRAFDDRGNERVLADDRPLAPAALVPILRDSTWPHRAKVMHRRLLAHGDSPLVTFAWDAPENPTRSLVEKNDERAIADVEAEALANLARLPYELERRDAGTVSVAHELAAELVLLPRALVAAQAALGADHILVGVPVRGFLVAMVPERAAGIVVATRKLFDGASRDRVSPVPFIARDGELVGFVREDAAPAKRRWRFW